MTARLVLLLFPATVFAETVNHTPESSLIDNQNEAGDDVSEEEEARIDAASRVRLLKLDPRMKDMLATDTVSQFDPTCFTHHCKDQLTHSMKMADFKKTWDCLQTTKDGSCVENKRWGDFPKYTMNVFDCGHNEGCMDIDLSGQTTDDGKGPQPSFIEETDTVTEDEHDDGEDDDFVSEEEFENAKDALRKSREVPSSFVEDDEEVDSMSDEEVLQNLIAILSDKDLMKDFTSDQVTELNKILKHQMQKIAVVQAVISTMEEKGEAPPRPSMIEESQKEEENAEWYKAVEKKLSGVMDLADMDPDSLIQQISEATEMIATAMEESDGKEPQVALEHALDSSLQSDVDKATEDMKVQKPVMQSVSVSADGHVENEPNERNLRNEK